MFCRLLSAASLRWCGVSSGLACHLASVCSGRWDFWGFLRSQSKWGSRTVHRESKSWQPGLHDGCWIFTRSSWQKNQLNKKKTQRVYYFIIIFFFQILGLSQEFGGVPHELHEVHHQPAFPSLPLHCGVCSAGDAAVWREVRTDILNCQWTRPNRFSFWFQ